MVINDKFTIINISTIKVGLVLYFDILRQHSLFRRCSFALSWSMGLLPHQGTSVKYLWMISFPPPYTIQGGRQHQSSGMGLDGSRTILMDLLRRCTRLWRILPSSQQSAM